MDSKEMEADVYNISPIISVGCCLFLATLYVASLYIWKPVHNRDHPSTVKKRFLSVAIVMLISPIIVYIFSSRKFLEKHSLWMILGLRSEGLLPAILVPYFLTAVFFSGPIFMQILNGSWRCYFSSEYWRLCLTNHLWLRNHVVAPISEEFTFRACMTPLLMQSFSPETSVLITPIFFGVAHFHHMIENIRNGMKKKTAVLTSCIQFTYTTIFGVYSAYLFAKTGHFLAPVVAHAFCNHQGFPDIPEVLRQEPSRRNLVFSIYLLGLIFWIILTPRCTNPEWYSNNLYWQFR